MSKFLGDFYVRLDSGIIDVGFFFLIKLKRRRVIFFFYVVNIIAFYWKLRCVFFEGGIKKVRGKFSELEKNM